MTSACLDRPNEAEHGQPYERPRVHEVILDISPTRLDLAGEVSRLGAEGIGQPPTIVGVAPEDVGAEDQREKGTPDEIFPAEKAPPQTEHRNSEEHRCLGTGESRQAEHQSRTRKAPAAASFFAAKELQPGEDEKHEQRRLQAE